MRTLLLCALLLLQQGATREVKDPSGRISLTVPEGWADVPVGGNQILRLSARDGGGHDAIVVVDAGQVDPERQRDRYLDYDIGKHPGGDVEKSTAPFLGFRLYLPKENLVILRAFVSDGEDGFVLSISSRHEGYDRIWKERLSAIAGTMRPVAGGGAPAGGGARAAGIAPKRRFDKKRRVSLVAPSDWKVSDPESPEEWMSLALVGSSGLPRIALTWWGGPTNASLVLTKVTAQWTRLYQNVTVQLLSQDPPTILVHGRKPEAVDYLVGLDDGSEGFTLHLCARENEFESLRKVADRIAATVVFADARFRPPEVPAEGIAKPFRKLAVVHAAPGLETALEAVHASLDAFEKAWKEAGIGDGRKSPPARIRVVPADDFPAASNGFGESPAAYDPLTRTVVVAAPPQDPDRLPEWRGALYRALARNLLVRDVPAVVPPWLSFGIASLLEAAARGEKGPEGPNPIYLGTLVRLADANQLTPFSTVLGASHVDYEKPGGADLPACAWGYVHLMRYGKGPAASLYRAFVKALESGKSRSPAFDTRNAKLEEELKAHVAKHLSAAE